MKKATLLLLFVISSLVGNGQGKLPSAYEIKADTATRQITIPDGNWQMMEDRVGDLTIRQVSGPAFDSRFHTNNTKPKGLNERIATYWMRYRIKNGMSCPLKITIPEAVSQAWLYTPLPGGKWKEQTNGAMVPWSRRDGLKHLKSFVATIAPGQELLFYEKDVFDFNNDSTGPLAVGIAFADSEIQKNYIDNDADFITGVLSALSFGVLLTAALINLLFYRVVREKAYLFFSLFLIVFGFGRFINMTDLLLREHEYLNKPITSILLVVTLYSLVHFVRNFLSTKVYTPKWDKFLITIGYIQTVVLVIEFCQRRGSSIQLNTTTNILVSLFVYGYLLILFVTVLHYARINAAGKSALIAAGPVLFWLIVGSGYQLIYTALIYSYKKPVSKVYSWITNNTEEIMLAIFLWMVGYFSWVLFKRYSDLQNSLVQSSLDREIERNQLIATQNEELEQQVEMRTTELSKSLNDLKATQNQLIQSEKMASLGELTAGIAHEIQNPLNFVNNFSEVNREMVTELKEALQAGNIGEALAIASDIEQNEEKIHHHGKRADGIVKGMLEHSRTSTGQKEPTDLNKLADEYLRLAYHGLRAKDKTFNAALITNFEQNLPLVNIIPQDIGRVLLNLFNNAFYATQQRQKAAKVDYKPEVTVATSAENGRMIIKVKDNGTGIPDAIKEKIMQPFFTTKPTGEGTGLGLSLTYDIVVKGHNGKIQVNAEEGECTEFTIELPVA
jgi:two-component system, NtrC family, sensor kinase